MTLCCLVPAHVLLMVYFVPLLLYLGAFCCFSLKMVPKCTAGVLPSVPRLKKVVMCLTEKIHVLDTIRVGMSYSTVGPECNVNE